MALTQEGHNPCRKLATLEQLIAEIATAKTLL